MGKQKIKHTTLILLLLLTLTWAAFPQEPEQRFTDDGIIHLPKSKRVMMKSLLLFRLPRHVQWPKESGMSNSFEPFVLGVIGDKEYFQEIEKISLRRKIKEKKVVVKYITDIKTIAQCHFIYVTMPEPVYLSKILSITKNKPILTCSDIPDSYKRGIHVTIQKNGKHYVLNLNAKAMKESGLVPAPPLLQVAVFAIMPEQKK